MVAQGKALPSELDQKNNMYSIQGRLIVSYIALTLLTVVLVGVLSLWLIHYYVTQQQDRSLLFNAQAMAEQAQLLMEPTVDRFMLEQLAHTSAFLGNVQVRILDQDYQLLADSGSQPHAEALLVVGPILLEEGILSDEELEQFMLSLQHEAEYPAFPPLMGRTIAKVSQDYDTWGSQFTIEFENEVVHHAVMTDGVLYHTEEQLIAIESQRLSQNTLISIDTTNTTTSQASETDHSIYDVLVPIGDSAQPLGYVALSHGADLSNEALSTTRQAFALAALGATLLAVIVGLFMSHRLTVPIHKLTDVTDRMSQGDLSVRAPVVGQDEISQLSSQFNEMAIRLEESFSDLAAERDTLRRFIADASHELRTPITALFTFNELLMGAAANDPDAQLEFLSESQAQLKRLEWITHNLLDLSRLEGGLLTLELELHDISDLLHAAVNPFRPLADERQIALELTCPANLRPLPCNRVRTILALSNLLDNALKFTPPGGQIRLGVTPHDTHFDIWIEDSGTGIPANDLPHIFERFYRGRDYHTTGSGLGLAIVQGIIDAHGWQISVESKVGRGTRMVIEAGSVMVPSSHATATTK